jgi:sugar transferase (PEP-CTERM/EpsH1 system associated)
MVRALSTNRPLIAHVVHRFAVGGLENGVVNLINRMSPVRWRHTVIALTDVDAEFRNRVQHSDVQFFELRKPPGHGVQLYPRLFRMFKELRPAVVHTRNLAALEASVPAWAASVPVRIHGEHGRDKIDLDGASKRYQWIRRIYSPFVSRYVVLSKDLEGYLTSNVGIAARRIHQIYNGVDALRFHRVGAQRSPVADSPFNDHSLWVVGYIGRMEEVKDPTNLARAFIHAVDSSSLARDRMRLVMVGGGRLEREVDQILRQARVRHLAWLPGERHDVPTLLQGLDCFVLPSLAEGVSNTILEAMASGLPVIATRVGGNAELVVDGTTGTLVPANDSHALSDAMLNYLQDTARAQTHGRSGHSRVEQHFSLDIMVKRYERLYESTLGPDRISPVSAPVA